MLHNETNKAVVVPNEYPQNMCSRFKKTLNNVTDFFMQSSNIFSRTSNIDVRIDIVLSKCKILLFCLHIQVFKKWNLCKIYLYHWRKISLTSKIRTTLNYSSFPPFFNYYSAWKNRQCKGLCGRNANIFIRKAKYPKICSFN